MSGDLAVQFAGAVHEPEWLFVPKKVMELNIACRTKLVV